MTFNATLSHHHYQSNSAQLAINAEYYMTQAKNETSLENQFSLYLTAFELCKRIKLNQLSELWQEKIINFINEASNQIIGCYPKVHALYQERKYPTYYKAYEATALMGRAQKILPKQHFNLFDPLINYPKLIEVAPLMNLLTPIIDHLNKPACFFNSSRYKKVANINKAFINANNHFQQPIVDLEQFVIYSEQNQFSVLQALQEGRIACSGTNVGSFKKFVAQLNKFAPGLGDSLYSLENKSRNAHLRNKN